MFKIIEKKFLSENVARLVIEAPYIAKSRRAGHFMILRIDKNGERIPLTISDVDLEKGTISVIVQRVGVTSHKLCDMNAGDYILDVVGPLGQPTHISNIGTVLCAGGGVGVAPLFPIVQAMKLAGNRVITVIAARNKDLVILENEMREYSDELIIMTDDGSKGTKGLVTQGMEEVILREKIDQAIVIGPAIMMKFAALTTKKYNIHTLASLNTIMVDGTGMCGACRVSVGGKTEFVCVNGPEFDAHEVNFDEMLSRLGAYKDKESEGYAEYLKSLEVEAI
ncbi:MAG: sulfide/dihydroorotate dehydrogenase-like FAD/NAD-binding protein [Lutibacter sp.]